MNGFEMLEKLPELNFKLIFTTSYDQYAIKAIRFSALDYLLKPVDKDELQKAVQKAMSVPGHPLPQQLEVLLHKLNHPKVVVNKIAIPTMEGLQMVLVENIIRCEADRNYTNLFLKKQGENNGFPKFEGSGRNAGRLFIHKSSPFPPGQFE